MYTGLMLMETFVMYNQKQLIITLKMLSKRLTIRCKLMGHYASMYLVGTLDWSFISSVVMALQQTGITGSSYVSNFVSYVLELYKKMK